VDRTAEKRLTAPRAPCADTDGGFLPGMTVVGNHNPAFAPAIQPTLRTGTEAAVAATLAYVGRVS
jgi:hypothetical protein